MTISSFLKMSAVSLLLLPQFAFAINGLDDDINPRDLPPKKRFSIEASMKEAKKRRCDVSSSREFIDLTVNGEQENIVSLQKPKELEEDRVAQNEILKQLAISYKLALDGHKAKLSGAITAYREMFPSDSRDDKTLMAILRRNCRGL